MGEVKIVLMDEVPLLKERLAALLQDEPLAVLATSQKNAPYANLVAFAAARDLKAIYFCTPKNTRKFQNLAENPKVCFLIHNQGGKKGDFDAGLAVTALGLCREVSPENKEQVRELFLNKHPELTTFLDSAETALMHFKVENYICVSGLSLVTNLAVG
jgi:nitroimidazol reductase NimA-like FMN-containing flavoprotein (pyridoxamine 5'-phosphate oxidase superfamily)